ncbi:ParB/RepB/Spo0J family partition protein [Lachnotalea glycerini]|uniref:ParB/RepB/Spo0J family partition protein n=1 Tax=Lachnotalea glycerini TaxID=1763509 RepID=A0A371JH98_9FIRM|nr:ParB/RepB/Spo0J family partition protein [Lachnotalea glycerini]RDY32118.1 ParB/RepB/Spo0J family partition protein [Lachnotalea glycerini]
MQEIKRVQLSKLKSFKNQPFKVETNTEFFALMQSIERDGILVPLLARTSIDGNEYELISGHRRKAACEWVGITEVPVIICEMNDNEATIAMVNSNIQRENIRLSEKAFAYKMRLVAMMRQGKRRDIISSQVGKSNKQYACYIRLTKLIPNILNIVDEEKIDFNVAVVLSYLKEEEQYELHAVMDLEQCTPSLSQAGRMKRMSQLDKLDMEMIYEILGEEKTNHNIQIKMIVESLESYFPSNFTEKQKVELIKILVSEWHSKQVDRKTKEK